MKSILLIVLLVAGAACATLPPATGSLNVAQILNDARWGVMAACDAPYLSPDDCTLTEEALTVADGIVAQNLSRVGPSVRQLLVTVEARLPADSRVRPYLDAIITLLQA